MELLQAFLTYLKHERNLAENTVEAYSSDLSTFLGFLSNHFNRQPSITSFSDLGARDVRAFLAERRRDGLGDASISRLLSAIKSFFRWLSEREGFDATAVLNARSPKFQPKLPRPVSAEAAVDVLLMSLVN